MDQVTNCIAKEDEIRSIEVLEVPIYGNKTERKSSHSESGKKCRDYYIFYYNDKQRLDDTVSVLGSYLGCLHVISFNK